METRTRLSRAALETLGVIAYRQPVSRAQIERIRGVDSDSPLATLLARSLIEETGRLDAPGRPAQFGTTDMFLAYFGIPSLDALPDVHIPQPEELGETKPTGDAPPSGGSSAS
jgi:segregation and condensation protein B